MSLSLDFKLENGNVEIDDDIYKSYCDAIAENEEMHYRHFLIDKKESLTIKESTCLLSQGTTGLCSWKAALNLADWCMENKSQIESKNILELGSGVGLTGLAVLKLCRPHKFIFSDYHPVVLKTLKENICNNFQSQAIAWEEMETNKMQKFNGSNIPTVEVLDLQWEEIDYSSFTKLQVDLIIGADILYDNSAFPSLVKLLRLFLYKSNNYAVIAATVRNESTIAEFLVELGKQHLTYEDQVVPSTQLFVKPDDTTTRILKISWGDL